MNSLKASVIIPAFNAEKYIGQTLETVLNQSVPQREYEVIVVDDGSTDGTAKIVNEFTGIKLIQQKNAGPARARNAGAKIAQESIVVFTDSDCIPEKNWLEEMLKPFANKEVAGVQGAYKTEQKEWIARFVQLEIEERYERMKKAKQLDWIGTYSAAYRRNVFLEQKGFDESFPKASGEDPEFSYRLQMKGYTLVFNPHAIVAHKHPTSVIKYLQKKEQHAYWRVLLYKKHLQKTVNDAYTPRMLKLQLIFTIVLGINVVGALLQPTASVYFVSGASIIWGASILPFIFYVAQRDLSLAVPAVPLVLARNLAMITGLGLGTIKFILGRN